MGDDKTALVPLDERTVDFYGDAVLAIQVEVEEKINIYVPLRPICKFLELSWTGQIERTKRDPVLTDALRYVRIDPRNGGGVQEMVVLPLEYLPGWLFGISVSRVHPRLHASLHRYRKECFRVLAAHFPQTFARALFDAHELPLAAGVPGTVYVASGGGYYKIGTSKSAEKRVKSLNSALPFQVMLVHTIDTDDAPLLKRRLHQVYRAAGKHVNGEWFRLTDADIVALQRIASPLLTQHIDECILALTSASDGKELVHER